MRGGQRYYVGDYDTMVYDGEAKVIEGEVNM